MPGTYDFTDDHHAVYGALGIKPNDTPIDRAWARCHDQDMQFGPALDEAKTVSIDGHDYLVQHFAHATASMADNKHNTNLTVAFRDGRGLITTESGL